MTSTEEKRPSGFFHQDQPHDLPEGKEEELKKVRSWLTTQTHLPSLTDEHVFIFLHSNYYDVEAAKSTIESYFTIKLSSPEVFLNRNPSDSRMQATWDMAYMVPLPKTTPEGYRVVIHALSQFEPSKFVHVEYLRAMFAFSDVLLSMNGYAPGYIIINDSKGGTLGHMTKMNLSLFRMSLKYIQEAMAIRLKGIHVINTVPFMEKVMTIAKPFIKSELLRIIHFHGSDYSTLAKSVPLEILPKDYGGQERSMAELHEENRRIIVEKYSDWIKDQDSLVEEMARRNPKKHAVPSLKGLSID